MSLLCRLRGHQLRGHPLDLDSDGNLLCRRCNAPLERGENGQWKEIEAAGDRLSRD